MKSFLTFAEALKGKQHKIDKNKNGKIDAHDFKLLRKEKVEDKEEQEQIDEISKSTLGSYVKKASLDMANRSAGVEKDLSAAKSDYNMMRRKGTKKTIAQNMMKKDVDTALSKVTKVSKRMSGIEKATDRLTREEAELTEKMNLAKASMGDVIKDFKKSDAPQFAGKSAEKRREMAIAAKLEADRGVKEEVKSSKPPFDAPYKKTAGDIKDKSGAVHTATSRAKHLAKTGMKSQTPVKEGVIGALAGGLLGGLAGGPLGLAAGAYLGHKAQQAGNNAKAVNKKLKKEEVEQIDELSFNTLASYASKVDQKDKQPLSKKRQAGYNSAAERMSQKAQTADLKKWGKISDSVEYNFDNEGNLMSNPVSFKQFIDQLDEIKMADLPSRKISGRGYGTEYYKKEAEKDKSGYDDEKKEKSEVKRGRGRPVGSASGARQKGSTTGKKRSGVEMTGYPLHLPNKN